MVLDKQNLDDKLRLVRQERYALQSAARVALPKERVSKCLRLVNNRSSVEVWRHIKTEKSFYNGLLVCGSVWNCPICAAKISERRKSELQTAFNGHKEDGGKIAMLTLTFSHSKFDRLKDLMQKLTKASSSFRSGKRFQNIRNMMGLIGSIRVFEITYSERNGFHPHIHLALFYTNDVLLPKMRFMMYQLWEAACNKVGLTVDYEHGLDLQGGEEADEYLSKHGTWSLEQELSKAHIKKAKFESMTPFDFLREFLETGDMDMMNLFKEYAEALKGKTQIYWSRGLKAKFIIEDKTDEEVAKEKLEDADLLGMIDWDMWKFILKIDNRAEFLAKTERYGFENTYDIYKYKKEQSEYTELS